MYVVIDKNTGRIQHINHAPVWQELTGTDVYHRFDPNTMSIIPHDGPLPEHYEIRDGRIQALSLAALVERGIVELPPGTLVRDGRVVEMGLREKVEAGLVHLDAHERIVEDDQGERVLTLSLRGQIDAGLVELRDTQKLDDRGDRIVDKSPEELVETGVITLVELKDQRKRALEQEALAARRAVVPDHELLYAALGLRSSEVVEGYKTLISRHENAVDKARTEVDGALTPYGVLGVKMELPDPQEGPR